MNINSFGSKLNIERSKIPQEGIKVERVSGLHFDTIQDILEKEQREAVNPVSSQREAVNPVSKPNKNFGSHQRDFYN
jgi:hypothetical protein